MKITKVDHITINMTEPEKSFEFYEKVFGLEKADTVDMGNHVLHLYKLPGDVKLELIEYKESQKTVSAGNTDIGVYRHFAVKTDDIKECKKRVDAAGFGINLEPTFIENLGITCMLIKDPNGVEVEVIQA